ncbi:hypothetical protein F1654_07450 [Alkalicaulis satelles]|uniref:Uncharacterized protein n=1 Tax=Alkalicaulis satelles TaxID=2609175 RepID=A0A5M6ZFX5_9PROT|nr:tetratricopeptide repeat protein [Alkalicaulis satelles]KAA5803629.1 hypothetical protein F1654_07450 [Alkalicaulis satelles]
MIFTAPVALARSVYRGGLTLVLAGLAASLLSSALFAQGGGRVVDNSPERPIAERFEPLLEVEALLAQGNQQAALARLNALFESHPDRAEPRVAAGMLTAGANPQMARAQFERALQLDPRETYAIAGLARLDMQAGQGQAALNRLTHGLALRPNSVELRIVLSELMAAAGRPAQAAGYLTEAFEVSIASEEERATLLVRAGELEGAAGNWRAAEAAFSRAYHYSPRPETRLLRGNARYHMGFPRLALADWEAVAQTEHGRRPDVAPALAEGIDQARAASVVRVTSEYRQRYWFLVPGNSRAATYSPDDTHLHFNFRPDDFSCRWTAAFDSSRETPRALLIDIYEHDPERGPWRPSSPGADGAKTYTILRADSADEYGVAAIVEREMRELTDVLRPRYSVSAISLSDPDEAERFADGAVLRPCTLAPNHYRIDPE